MDKEELYALVNLITEMADEMADGHLTIFKFTTGWKVAFKTPMLDISVGDRQKVQEIETSESLDEALKNAIKNQTCFF